MRALITTLATFAAIGMIAAQQPAAPDGPLTLEQCRSMALVNNKDMKVADQKIRTAEYQKKEAFFPFKIF